jgi:hypothetical protein
MQSSILKKEVVQLSRSFKVKSVKVKSVKVKSVKVKSVKVKVPINFSNVNYNVESKTAITSSFEIATAGKEKLPKTLVRKKLI